MVSRADVIAEAERLMGVKWVHQGRSEKFGVDCIGLIGVVGYNLEIVEPAGVPNYSRRPNKTFLPLFRATQLIEILPKDALPGDILVFSKMGHPYHCGIKTIFYDEPAVIHAYAVARKVTVENLATVVQVVGVFTHSFKYPNLTDL